MKQFQPEHGSAPEPGTPEQLRLVRLCPCFTYSTYLPSRSVVPLLNSVTLLQKPPPQPPPDVLTSSFNNRLLLTYSSSFAPDSHPIPTLQILLPFSSSLICSPTFKLLRPFSSSELNLLHMLHLQIFIATMFTNIKLTPQ